MNDSTQAHSASKLTSRTHSFQFEDPFINDHHDRVVSKLVELEAQAAEYFGPDAGSHRKRLSSIDYATPATKSFVAQAPDIKHWMSIIPTAAALHTCYNPESEFYPGGHPVSEEFRQWFRNIADTRGIRSRAEVMRRLLTAEAASYGPDARWLSLACGAAQPMFRTMEGLRESGVPVPHTTLTDLDKNALSLAASYASDHDLSERTALSRLNVLDIKGFGRTRRRSRVRSRRPDWTGAFDAVDTVGLLEYLKPDDWTYTYQGVIRTRRRQAGAVTFLRNAFECVRPGGLLVVGNMLDTHPQLGFTMNVVQWPHIQPRSIGQMRHLFEAAGLTGHLDIHLPDDGVYAIYAIRKALDAES